MRNALTDTIIFAVCFIGLKTTRVNLRGEIYTDKQAVIKTSCVVFVQLMLLTVLICKWER